MTLLRIDSLNAIAGLLSTEAFCPVNKKVLTVCTTINVISYFACPLQNFPMMLGSFRNKALDFVIGAFSHKALKWR